MINRSNKFNLNKFWNRFIRSKFLYFWWFKWKVRWHMNIQCKYMIGIGWIVLKKTNKNENNRSLSYFLSILVQQFALPNAELENILNSIKIKSIINHLLSLDFGSNLLICAEFSLAALNSYVRKKNINVLERKILFSFFVSTFNNRLCIVAMFFPFKLIRK